MDVTSAQEYKKTRYKTITLPSNAVFEIRKLTRSLLFELGALTDRIKDVKPDASLSPEQLEAFSKLYDKVLTTCVVRPKIVLANPKEDELSVEDIDIMDQTAAVTQIFEYSGLTGEAAEARKNL